MNISKSINPLIFGREGIDDRLWKVRVSQTTEKDYTAKIYFTNIVEIKPKNSGYESRYVPFKLTFKLALTGEIEYYKAGLTDRNNGTLQLKARDKTREFFSELRLINRRK